MSWLPSKIPTCPHCMCLVQRAKVADMDVYVCGSCDTFAPWNTVVWKERERRGLHKEAK